MCTVFVFGGRRVFTFIQHHSFATRHFCTVREQCADTIRVGVEGYSLESLICFDIIGAVAYFKNEATMYHTVHSTHVTLHAALMCNLHQFNDSRFKLVFSDCLLLSFAALFGRAHMFVE